MKSQAVGVGVPVVPELVVSLVLWSKVRELQAAELISALVKFL